VKLALKLLVGLVVLVAVGLFVDRQLHVPSPPPTPSEIEALQKRRDELGLQIRERVVKAGEKSLAKAPRAGIMIGIPVGFARSIVDQVVTGLFRETTLTLKNLRVHKEGAVKTKMVFRKKQVGQFVLDVLVHEAKGELRPGKPRLDFGDNRIKVALPVALAGGEGRAQLGFKWDSKGLAANVVCGDVDTTREVTGKVVPEDYHVVGVFGMSTDGNAITLRPDFGEFAVRIFVTPTEQAWQVVDAVVAEQRAGCREVLEKIDIKKILAKLLDKGFNVKIPKKIFKPIRLPAGVQQSLNLQGVKLDLTVKATGLVVSDDRLWYGADLRAARGGPVPSPKPQAVGSTPSSPTPPLRPGTRDGG
jgi:hypothetical protein